MFNLKRVYNWAHSSARDDKQELEYYQALLDTIANIYSKCEEYIKDLNLDDDRLKIDYNGEKVSINFLDIIKDSILHDMSLPIEERARKSAQLNNLYYIKLKELKERIIDLAVSCTDNVYLAYINSYIRMLNNLLKSYRGLLAIQKSEVQIINNEGTMASQKIKTIKNNIEIRSAEIHARLSLEERRKK